MAKRKGLGEFSAIAAQARGETPAAAVRSEEPAPYGREYTDQCRTTAIHLPERQLKLLRRAATEVANREGGRPSVSRILADLIERHRAELERLGERD